MENANWDDISGNRSAPYINQTLLPRGKRPCDQRYRVETEDADILLIVSMQVRQVVWAADLGVHANDDSEEPADLGHAKSLRCASRKCNGLQIRDRDQATFPACDYGDTCSVPDFRSRSNFRLPKCEHVVHKTRLFRRR